MKPNLSILPEAQKKLWPQLSGVPKEFILYGGTAIALQIGHRISVDFDFFSSRPLNKDLLIKELSFLRKAQIVHPEINTLNCNVSFPEGDVQLQFLAGINTRQGRVENVLSCEDNGVRVASLRDLFATKLNTIQMRAEIKDYVDIEALLRFGLKLDDGLACASAIYGENFDPATSLRALVSYRDGDLPQLSNDIKVRLQAAALKIESIPKVTAVSATL